MTVILTSMPDSLRTDASPRTRDGGPALLTLADCEAMSVATARSLYRAHVSPALGTVIDSFDTGRVMVDRAEGVWITARDGRRILDATGGMGVLAIGHNHPRVLAARRRYAEAGHMAPHQP